MRQIYLIGILVGLIYSHGLELNAQEFDELVLEEISHTDSAGIFTLSGSITDLDRNSRQYYIYLYDRYGNAYLQRPSCSIMRDSFFNHYNIIILPYNSGDYKSIQMLSVKNTNRRTIRKLNEMTSAGIPLQRFKEALPDVNFLPNPYRITKIL